MGSILPLLLFLSGFLLTFASASDFEKEEIYRGCGDTTKMCFGDVDGCIGSKNCTFIVTATENRTHYVAEIQNNCNVAENNVFFGVGVGALVKEGPNASPKYSCTPKFADFKYIILWEGEKCTKEGVIQKKWGHMLKGVGGQCPPSKVENLLDFVQKSMLVQAGTIPTSLIEKKNYMEKNDGAFFTNSGNSLHLHQLLTVLASVLVFSVYKNA